MIIKKQHEELTRLKRELYEKARSKDGVWVRGENKILATIFPDWSNEQKQALLKINIKPDSVYVYSFWDDGLPCLQVYDHAELGHFELTEDKVRFCTISLPAITVSKQDNDPRSNEEYIDWFLENYSISRKEYEEVVIGDQRKSLSFVEVARMR